MKKKLKEITIEELIKKYPNLIHTLEELRKAGKLDDLNLEYEVEENEK